MPTEARPAAAFELENADDSENFNLKPKDNHHGPIPEDQRKISHEVYEARNILKLLKAQGAFKRQGPAYDEFMKRVVQAARAGCAAPHEVDTNLAASALEQIRADVVRRKGRPLMYRYLAFLGAWALAGVAVAMVIVFAASFSRPELKGYGLVIMASMAGAWISVAATRREISFDGIQDFVDVMFEPLIRMVFVGALASAFALFLHLKFLTVKVGAADLGSFTTSIGSALALGLIAGIGEKAVSVQVIERARKVLTPGSR